MCGNLFSKPKSPKVQAVAPAPTQVSQPESQAISDQQNADNRRRRAAFGADKARIVANNSLLSQAQSGAKSKLGD